MERILTAKTADKTGSDVKVSGWVDARRDHGKIIFIDLRDRSGVLQCVFVPGSEDVYKAGDSLRPEWVVELEGKIAARP
ncbi:MAG: OB-fold nucleic acid binding domain-containing protein, partial [Patescibacteria group bacterium]